MSAHQLITDHLDLWTQAVTKKSTAGRGRSGKIELTGIKKLRELILELAFKGKLVEQNPNAESAEVLLARLKDEKLELEKSKKIKKKRKPNESTNIDNLTDLPGNWCWSQLGEIAFKLTDGSHNPPKDAGSGVPMLSSQNVNSGRIDFERPSRYVTVEDYVKEDNRTEARPGDVLLTIVASLGRSAVVPQEAPQFVLQRSVAVISTPMSSEFLSYQFIAPQCLAYYDTHGKGTAQKGIYLGKLAVMPIAVPPLEEQHRIVQKVDELMALCDRLEQHTSDQLNAHETLVDTLLGTLTQSANATELADNWARLAEHFDTLFTTEQSIGKLKQTILQLAVMGRLVEQDEGDEPAEKMLDQLAEVKRELITQGLLKKERKSEPGNSEDAPYEIPESWSWCSLTDIGELARGKSKHRPRNDPSLYQDGTVPLVQTGDVARASPWITTFSARYNQRGLEQSRLWRPGTLCITIAANIGDTGLLSFDACFPDSVVGFTPFWGDIPPEYFEYFLRTAKQHLEDFAPSTAQKNINLEVLQKLLVPLPPVSEMKRIVQKVDELMALCDHLKHRLTQASNTRCQLAGAVVEQAIN
ncbi:restriction endonuclease subunit S [Vreelandella venusta]|uniref:restriction endonuclease subunit S n=1 Tax=Vreelandella venusta TaxID=44935 RepID=UPI003F6777BE